MAPERRPPRQRRRRPRDQFARLGPDPDRARPGLRALHPRRSAAPRGRRAPAAARPRPRGRGRRLRGRPAGVRLDQRCRPARCRRTRCTSAASPRRSGSRPTACSPSATRAEPVPWPSPPDRASKVRSPESERQSMRDTHPELSVVVPMYDEEEVLPIFFERMHPLLDGLGISYELLVVDDGSRDTTAALLARRRQGLAAAPCRPPAPQQRSPGRPVGRLPPRPRAVRRHDRRRPAGSARGHRRVAAGGP